MKSDEEIVYIKLDDWNDMGDAESYLKDLEGGRLDKEVNYNEVWYDMAIIYCITTTRHYVDMHPELEEHICEGNYFENHDIFRPYFPEYDPEHFGCEWFGEYEGWAPYKDFNKKAWEHCVKQGWVDEEGNIKNR